MFMPHVSFLYKAKDQKEKIMDFFDSKIREDITIEETLNYDYKTNIISVNWDYINVENIIHHTFKFQMKVYYPDTMNRLLVDSGLTVQSLWGNYDGSVLTEKSNVQLYDCTL